MAGTQVRWASDRGPMRTGLNSSEAAATSRVGAFPGSDVCLMRSGGFHMTVL
jgi:hypothetical protein